VVAWRRCEESLPGGSAILYYLSGTSSRSWRVRGITLVMRAAEADDLSGLAGLSTGRPAGHHPDACHGVAGGIRRWLGSSGSLLLKRSWTRTGLLWLVAVALAGVVISLYTISA